MLKKYERKTAFDLMEMSLPEVLNYRPKHGLPDINRFLEYAEKRSDLRRNLTSDREISARGREAFQRAYEEYFSDDQPEERQIQRIWLEAQFGAEDYPDNVDLSEFPLFTETRFEDVQGIIQAGTEGFLDYMTETGVLTSLFARTIQTEPDPAGVLYSYFEHFPTLRDVLCVFELPVVPKNLPVLRNIMYNELVLKLHNDEAYNQLAFEFGLEPSELRFREGTGIIEYPYRNVSEIFDLIMVGDRWDDLPYKMLALALVRHELTDGRELEDLAGVLDNRVPDEMSLDDYLDLGVEFLLVPLIFEQTNGALVMDLTQYPYDRQFSTIRDLVTCQDEAKVLDFLTPYVLRDWENAEDPAEARRKKIEETVDGVCMNYGVELFSTEIQPKPAEADEAAAEASPTEDDDAVIDAEAVEMDVDEPEAEDEPEEPSELSDSSEFSESETDSDAEPEEDAEAGSEGEADETDDDDEEEPVVGDTHFQIEE